MANVKLIFSGTERSSTDNYELEAYVNSFNEIFLTLENNEGCAHICLDISTAIKFAKTLRTEINKAKEVQNGN